MADNSTPAPGTPPASTPAPGTGTSPQATPPVPSPSPSGIPTEPAQAAEYWKARHEEATATITRTTQQNARYRDMYGELENAPAAPQTPNVEQIVDTRLKAWEIDQRISRVPSLTPYAQEIKDLMGTGKVNLDRAMKIIAEDHNVVLSPSTPADIELMPTAPGGGGAPSAGGSVPPEIERTLAAEGGNVEAAKKHLPLINKVWNKALKRG